MLLRSLIAFTVIAAVLPFAAAPHAVAQTPPPVPPPHHTQRRITINPRPLLYRRCEDWYELQHRPSGTVLYPQMRCWWVRG